MTRRTFLRALAALAGGLGGLAISARGQELAMQLDRIAHYHSLRRKSRRGRDLVVPGSEKDASLQTEILDHFTGADATNLTAHSPDYGGAAWTQWAAGFTIQGNVAAVQSELAIDVQNSQYFDGVITCRFKCGGANGNYAPSIVFRGTDASYFFYFYFSGDGNLLLRKRAGGWSTIASTTWAADANWHTAVITMAGTTVSLSLDGGAAWTNNDVTNGQHMGTYHGILGFLYGGASDSFDDFQVQGIHVPAFPGPYPVVHFADDFGGADGTQLSTRGWTEDVDSWQCQGGKGQVVTNPTTSQGGICTRAVGLADCAMEVKVTTPASGNLCPGFAFRVQDATHFIELELNNSDTYNGWAGFGIWAYDGGAPFTVVMVRYFLPQPSTTYTLRLRLLGNVIIAEIVEANLVMVGSSAFFNTATKHGLYDSRPVGYGQNVFEDFVMRVR